MNIASQKNIAAFLTPKALSLPYAWTAAGASDAITFTGLSIDRESFSTGALPLSADIDVYYAATLGSGATLSLTLDLQTGPDNSTWTDFATQAATVIATGPSGGGAVSGIARMTLPSSADNPTPSPGIKLANAQRYTRLLVVPDLSRTGTDTAVIAAFGVFGGFDQYPSPVS